MTRPDIDAIAERAAEATPGPWGWRGYIDGSIELRSLYGLGDRVVSTIRAAPCVVETISGSITLTAEACEPCKAEMKKTLDPFVDYRCPKLENLDTVWLQGDGVIRPANEWAVREVPYRGDVESVEHPDARFIAGARSDVPALLAYIDELEGQLRTTKSEADENFAHSVASAADERWEKGLWP